MKSLDAVNKCRNNHFKVTTLAFIVFVGFLVFTMGIIRGRCISEGYVLSNMAEEIEHRKILIDKCEASRSAMISKEILFTLAGREFIFMEEGKTFNVQR